ncbi:MAG: PQQ-dependent sugar dehydrogenase [Cumulibacter sp.]
MQLRSRFGLSGIAISVAMVLLSGCASDEGNYTGSGNWVEQGSPAVPNIPQPEEPGPPTGSEPESEGEGASDNVRATDLDQPVALTALPDGTALVAERVSGTVTQVFPAKELKQKALYTVSGIDGSDGGGLVSMAASPKYLENGLVYAYVTTKTDGRIVSLNGKGVTKDIVTGLPKAPAALTFGPDGSLLIAIGGSGSQYSGKILAIDHWGDPAPAATEGIVMSQGVSNPLGLCTNGIGVYVVNGGSADSGQLSGNAVYEVAGPSKDQGGMNAMSPIISYSEESAGAAGCAATEVQIATAGTDSESLAKSVLSQDGTVNGSPVLQYTGEFGRLRAIAFDPVGGGYWVSTYNTDGIGDPAEDDDKVLYLPEQSGAGSGDVS